MKKAKTKTKTKEKEKEKKNPTLQKAAFQLH